jgi:hypothetical protein
MEHLFIVLCRASSQYRWMPSPDGVFESRNLAEQHIERANANFRSMEFAVVEGPITNPGEMAEAQA